MSMAAIKTPYIGNLFELIANNRMGETDIIAEVNKALLGDIFVLISKFYNS